MIMLDVSMDACVHRSKCPIRAISDFRVYCPGSRETCISITSNGSPDNNLPSYLDRGGDNSFEIIRYADTLKLHVERIRLKKDARHQTGRHPHFKATAAAGV